MCHRLMCTWLPGTEKGASRGYRLGIAKIHLIVFQIWSVDTVVFCRKAASSNNSGAKLESAERQAKQCKFTFISMETLFSNDNNLSQGSFTKQQQWGDKFSGEAIDMAKVQVESQ